MNTLLPDVRHAFRGLSQARWFSTMAIGTLALGIAGATAVFSLIDAVLLRPLPYAAPERLVSLHERRGGVAIGPLSAHEVVAWRERNRVFDGIGAYLYSQFTLTGAGDPTTVQAQTVTANYFDVLGTPARLGRAFSEGEDRAGANLVAVLSDRFWRSRFGEQPAVVGRNILLNNVGHRIVGVMPPGGDLDPDLWVPVDWPLEARRVGRHGDLRVRAVERRRRDRNRPRRHRRHRGGAGQGAPRRQHRSRHGRRVVARRRRGRGGASHRGSRRRGRLRAAHRLRQRGAICC